MRCHQGFRKKLSTKYFPKSKIIMSLPDINVLQAIENGIRHVVLNSKTYGGVVKISVVDSLGNISLEKKTVMFPKLNLRLKLPSKRGTLFVIIDSEKGEVVKRLRTGDSFFNNPV